MIDSLCSCLLATSIFFSGPVEYDGPDAPRSDGTWFGTAKVIWVGDDYERATLVYASNTPSGTVVSELERAVMDEENRKIYESKDNLIELALHTYGDWVSDSLLTDQNFNDRVDSMMLTWWPEELNPYGMFRTASVMTERDGWRVTFLDLGGRVPEPLYWNGMAAMVVIALARRRHCESSLDS